MSVITQKFRQFGTALVNFLAGSDDLNSPTYRQVNFIRSEIEKDQAQGIQHPAIGAKLSEMSNLLRELPPTPNVAALAVWGAKQSTVLHNGEIEGGFATSWLEVYNQLFRTDRTSALAQARKENATAGSFLLAGVIRSVEVGAATYRERPRQKHEHV